MDIFALKNFKKYTSAVQISPIFVLYAKKYNVLARALINRRAAALGRDLGEGSGADYRAGNGPRGAEIGG